MTVAAPAALSGALSWKPLFASRASASGTPKAIMEFATMFVATWPGITTATRTCGACTRKSSMSASENPFTANLAVE